jgi:serine/threonine-protein kinase
VADFGIARELGGLSTPTLTATGMVLGTAQYFAPEQAQGRPATPQSDVYAAGIVLFEMLTGRLPFDGENPLGVAMQQINQPPPLPRTINPAIPPAVEAIVLKALAKNPAERYPTAGAMKAAVDAARTGAANPTRLATRVAPAAPPPPPPGVTRQSTRPTPVVAAPPPPPPARNATERILWIVAAVLVAIAAFAVARYLTGGGFPGAGGAPTATPTGTATPRPTATASPTKRPVIVPPTRTQTATHTPAPSHTPTPTETHIPAATATDTPAPPTNTPAATATDTPAPSPTAPPPTDTAVPTATTLAPTDTPVPSPSATAPLASATATGVSLQLAPSTARPGDTVAVSGSGWPPDTKVAISTDYTENQQQVADALVGPDGTFSVDVTLPQGLAAGTYTLTASDAQGDTASQTLTVTI